MSSRAVYREAEFYQIALPTVKKISVDVKYIAFEVADGNIRIHGDLASIELGDIASIAVRPITAEKVNGMYSWPLEAFGESHIPTLNMLAKHHWKVITEAVAVWDRSALHTYTLVHNGKPSQ
eukprot:CAMPEP_0168513686 /NCGR_PEP_ID=MMETSP0405-20121227/3632_1 /TAXON_ID=498012 /ORGANISM="Trichosphaerium sp, Strain Am-I-7 wt" /LENGTH=121 /DNA_ID=CAMNT_0008532609 /DNA_START=233 /DNA_END=595 /DNA_ORIENTATION=+